MSATSTPARASVTTPTPPWPPSRRFAASASTATGSQYQALPPNSAPRPRVEFNIRLQDLSSKTPRLTLQPSPTSRIPDQEHGPPARQQVSGQISRKPAERRQRAHSRTRAVAG